MAGYTVISFPHSIKGDEVTSKDFSEQEVAEMNRYIVSLLDKNLCYLQIKKGRCNANGETVNKILNKGRYPFYKRLFLISELLFAGFIVFLILYLKRYI